jgi:hypothetical protein
VISSCAYNGVVNKQMSSLTETPPVVEDPSKALEQDKPDFQNRMERQLVGLFQAIVQMDGKEGLTISSEQARKLLPIVRKSKDEGRISEQEQEQVLELLTQAQKTFYEQFTQKMHERMQGKPMIRFDELSPEERDKLIEAFKQKRKDEVEAGHFPENKFEEGPHPWGGVKGTSMEQQLILLLESKVQTSE